MKLCNHCKELILSDYISNRDVCPGCGRDLHICLNCVFYDPMSHHECREPQSEFVGEKDKNNFCDYFRFQTQKREKNSGNDVEDARAKLEALFDKSG